MGDVTMPDTLPTVEHTFFCAYLSTASWAEDRIEPREGIENDRSMIWLTLAKQESFTSNRLSTFGVAEAIWLCAPMAVLMLAPMPTSSQFFKSSCIFWVMAASTAAICDETPELAPLVWDAPALAASASDAPTSTPMAGLVRAFLFMAAPPDASELDGAGLRLAGFEQATLDLANVARAVFLEACGFHDFGHLCPHRLDGVADAFVLVAVEDRDGRHLERAEHGQRLGKIVVAIEPTVCQAESAQHPPHHRQATPPGHSRAARGPAGAWPQSPAAGAFAPRGGAGI